MVTPAWQQVGAALSVAVLGSVLTAAYTAAMPAGALGPARHSIGEALRIAAATGDGALARLARDAFGSAMSTTAVVGVVGGIAAAAVAVAVLRPRKPADPAPLTPAPAPVGDEVTAD